MYLFSSIILLNFLPQMNRYCTTFGPLAEIEREAKNDNSACKWLCTEY